MEYKLINLNIENKSIEEKFRITCDKLSNLQIKIDNETKLKFYGLFKVVTVGKYDPTTNNASLFDFSAKYKK
jgi:acyl-CoA-binding protein